MKTMKKSRLTLYILAGICFTITVVDTIMHHSLNPIYACVTAADLCAIASLSQLEKPTEQ